MLPSERAPFEAQAAAQKAALTKRVTTAAAAAVGVVPGGEGAAADGDDGVSQVHCGEEEKTIGKKAGRKKAIS